MFQQDQTIQNSLFIMLFKEKITENSKPGRDIYYDPQLQVWREKTKGNRIFVDTIKELESSDFGETTMTKTAEGADQIEGLRNSDFGETTMTFTVEGADSTERIDAIRSSEFGETTLTETFEGADQREFI